MKAMAITVLMITALYFTVSFLGKGPIPSKATMLEDRVDEKMSSTKPVSEFPL